MNERLSDLSSRERELVEAVAVGGVLVCSRLSREQLAVTDDPQHIIRAEVLRDLLVTRCDKPPDPRGVRLRGARITGTLDLTHVQAPVGMELRDCCVDQVVLLRDAHLPWLTLSGSRVPAVSGDGLRVDGSLWLRAGFCVTGGDEAEAVWLTGARIGGQLDLRGAELINRNGPALFGDDLQVDGGLFLSGFRAIGAGKGGVVRLLGARICGQLELSGTKLTNNQDGPALHGDGLQVDGPAFLRGFHATGGGELGVVRLLGARIGGQLSLSGAELTNQEGPALLGDKLQVDGGLFLDGFRATGHGKGGAVRLLGARIGGQLNLRGAKLTNKDGPALQGDRLQVDGGLFLSEGFRATGCGELGAVWLLGARIGGQLNLQRAVLTNKDYGPALVGDRLQVDGDLFLSEGFRATGRDERGAVRLVGARIGGQLNLRGAKLTHMDGLILNLQGAEAKQFFLPPQVICPRAVAGRSTCGDATRQVDLADFVYTTHDGDWRQWLHLIVRHTDQYWPQPYQQLAAVQRAEGHDSAVRKILIVQQDLRKHGTIGRGLPRIVHTLWGWVGGYGYSINRTALTLLVFLVVAGALGVIAGHLPTSPGRYVAMHTLQSPNPNTPCSFFEQIRVGIDRSLPLSPTSILSRCDVDTITRRGQVISAISGVIQVMSWVLAAMVVAGYSGLIRKAT